MLAALIAISCSTIPHAGQTDADSPASGIQMVALSGGAFSRGSNTPGDYASPIHSATLSAFRISRFEITQELYQATVGKNPSAKNGPSLPVDSVSWYDAVEFCNALSLRDGLQPVYSIDKTKADPNNVGSSDPLKWTVAQDMTKSGYRLPTEAEWEYAYRAGSAGDFYWGNAINDDYLWYDGNSGAVTHPVGMRTPNAFGLYDMSGNVWEWCWDWWTDYSQYASALSTTNPVGQAAGENRMFKGGGATSKATDPIRAASHAWNANPNYRDGNLGFRVVRK
jgi:formylglycine-generating enzyme required for sulfatase activity